jgi:hypothetical protein
VLAVLLRYADSDYPFPNSSNWYFVNEENDVSSNKNIIYKSINDLTLYVDNYIKYNK